MRHRLASLFLATLVLALLFSALNISPRLTRAQGAPELPDLIVDKIECGPGSKLAVTVKNIGAAALPAGWMALAEVYFNQQKMGFFDLRYPTTTTGGSIASPGGSSYYLLSWDITQQVSVFVVADYTSSITESNEQNNTRLELISPCPTPTPTPVPSLPDLIVDKIDCGPGSKLAVTVKNIGAGTLQAGWTAQAGIYFNQQYMGFFDLKYPTSTTGGGIEQPGGSSYYLLSWDITQQVSALVVADFTSSVTESNEQNNTRFELISPCGAPTPSPSPSPTPTPTATPTPTPSPSPSPTPTPTPVIFVTPPHVYTACLYSISGTIHNFFYDETMLKIKICEAETITTTSSDPRVPPITITQCKEGGWVGYADVTRVMTGDLPGPDLVYTFSRLCPGEYIVAPARGLRSPCEWQGDWRASRGQVVRITSSNATGYDFTFTPLDSRTPTVSIWTSSDNPDLEEDVVIKILADDDQGISYIWHKGDIVFTDGSTTGGIWNSATITPNMDGHTAGVRLTLTENNILRATITAKVCDVGGNQRSATKTIIWGGCDDGVRNHGETGIDCGGPCPAQCKDCLSDLTLGTNPSAYLYSPEQWTNIRSTALGALSEYANEQDIDYSELDTADEYIEAISWWVARHMGYRGDDINDACINDVQGLDYDPADYEHYDFVQPAYYTLTYSGCPCCDGVTYYEEVEGTHSTVAKTWHADPTKWFYGDCDDFAILHAALLRSLGVSHRCIFNAEQPGHAFNIVYYKGKYRVLEPQVAEIGCEYYGPDNLWNDKIGAFACTDFPKVLPWQYAMNYAGCESPSVSLSGGGFSEKTLWLDWNGWGRNNVKPGVADVNHDGRDDIAAVRSYMVGGGVGFQDYRFNSSGSSFVKDFGESAIADGEWPFFYTLSLDDSVTGLQGTAEGGTGTVVRYGHVESPTANNYITFHRNSGTVGDVNVSFSDETIPQISFASGKLRIEVTDATTYDHWNNVDRAPQLRYSPGSGDWTMETSVMVSDRYGSDTTHHAGLMVRFSNDDIVYFGLFSWGLGENVCIQRSGYGMIDYHRVSTDQIYLKIEKTGNTYKFYSKTRPDYSWTLEETVTIAGYPLSVGLILKTWEPSAIYADFDYFDFVSSSRSFRDDFNGPLGDDWNIYIPTPTWHGSFCVDSEIPFVGDFDGDGLDDIITFKNQRGAGEGDVYVALSQPEKGEFGLGLLWTNNFCLRNEIPLVGDFNGDGRDDIVTFNRDTGKVYVALSTIFGFRGSRWQWHSDFCRGSNSTPLVGDFNGDGRDDIACVTLDGTRARVWVALSNPSTITYYWPGGCSSCSAATFYTKAYYPEICP